MSSAVIVLWSLFFVPEQPTKKQLLAEKQKIENTEAPAIEKTEIVKEISGQKTIAISFKKMVDGSAYSLAAKIKEIADDVELHAVGKINLEICYFLKRSGFRIAHFDIFSEESVFVKEPREMASILNPFDEHYQSGNDNSKGIY